jgi:two-component sensor histidine kinase
LPQRFPAPGQNHRWSAPARPWSITAGLHELATNTAKYGALSRPSGRARISWKAYRAGSGEQRFKFKWQESGGPGVTQPQWRGFGTLLMTRAFADIQGQSRLTHAPEGLRYRVDAPLIGRLGRLSDGS